MLQNTYKHLRFKRRINLAAKTVILDAKDLHYVNKLGRVLLPLGSSLVDIFVFALWEHSSEQLEISEKGINDKIKSNINYQFSTTLMAMRPLYRCGKPRSTGTQMKQ